MNILITICARGGSKGIKNKNIIKLNGKPLIHYTIEVAQRYAETNCNVIIGLSTDSLEIIKSAKEKGLETKYIRPDNLATDFVSKPDVIKDLLFFEEENKKCKFDYVIDLDVTSPMRNVSDIEASMQLLLQNREALNIFSVNPANRNPYFNMVEEKNDGFFRVVKSNGAISSRQLAPKVFDMNSSIYIYRRKFFDQNQRFTTTEKSIVYETPHVCFDIDEINDLRLMELMIKNKLLDFDL